MKNSITIKISEDIAEIDGIRYRLVAIEEIKEKPAYPKILEFKAENYNEPYTLNEDGTYSNKKYKNVSPKYTLEHLLTAHPGIESGKVLIWKVAKNGNEIFTVGDLTNKGKILEFEYDHGDINIYTDISDWLCTFEGLEHKKEPILTTEDGVEIYDENQIIYVLIPSLAWAKSEREAMYNEKSNLKLYFSTDEAREYYIKDYTKIYSRKQIKEAIKSINLGKYLWNEKLIKILDL